MIQKESIYNDNDELMAKTLRTIDDNGKLITLVEITYSPDRRVRTVISKDVNGNLFQKKVEYRGTKHLAHKPIRDVTVSYADWDLTDPLFTIKNEFTWDKDAECKTIKTDYYDNKDELVWTKRIKCFKVVDGKKTGTYVMTKSKGDRLLEKVTTRYFYKDDKKIKKVIKTQNLEINMSTIETKTYENGIHIETEEFYNSEFKPE